MKSILVKLAKIGDSLDKSGHYSLANEVDFIIMKYSSPPDFQKLTNGDEITLEIPEEELEEINAALVALEEDLEGNENI